MKKMIFTLDVEPDLHTNKDKGIKEGLKIFENLCDKNKIKSTLFVVSSIIPKNKDIFMRLSKKGWEISLHGLTHRRFDEMNFKEKEYEIKESLRIFNKYLKIKPKGFRAPQHSIDDETLDLLEKYKLKYDSSYTPFNLFQLIFFPKKINQFLKQFFSKTNPYLIKPNLNEIPVPSILIPPVSLIVRVFPKWFLFIYFKILKSTYSSPVFYAHSWDFIEIKESKIDRFFNRKKFIKKLDYVMSLEK